jgi:TolA-binding protein
MAQQYDISNVAAYWLQGVPAVLSIIVTIWLSKKPNAIESAVEQRHNVHTSSISALQIGDSARQLAVATTQSDTSELRRQVRGLRLALDILQHQNSSLHAEIETSKSFSILQEKRIEKQETEMAAMQRTVDQMSDSLRQNLCLERTRIDARLVKLEAARPVTVTAPPVTSKADSPTDRDPAAPGGASTTSASGNLARKDSAREKGARKPEWKRP